MSEVGCVWQRSYLQIQDYSEAAIGIVGNPNYDSLLSAIPYFIFDLCIRIIDYSRLRSFRLFPTVFFFDFHFFKI